jgi:hypothetical protein
MDEDKKTTLTDDTQSDSEADVYMDDTSDDLGNDEVLDIDDLV